jgi:O-antigen ligase
MVLVGEMAFVYLTYDNLYDEAGSVIKESIVLGWGVCNPIGYSLGVLIPILMLGAMRERFSIIYFAGAIICWGTAIITLSRNALLFATLFLGISVISGCFIGKRKKLFRIMTAAAAVMGVIVFILIFGKLKVLLIDFVNRGLSDTGRFELWKLGIENFKQYPIFGTGFFGYNDNHTFIAANFLPTMAHNTIVQLLSSMGIFGLLAYLYYRVSIFIPIIRKITTEKYMLMLSLLYTMASSLLDNFVFYIYTVFLYAVILAVLVRISEKQKKEDTQ